MGTRLKRYHRLPAWRTPRDVPKSTGTPCGAIAVDTNGARWNEAARLRMPRRCCGMRDRTESRVRIRRWSVVGLAVLLLSTGPAHGFYWKNWPGSRVKTPETLTPGNEPGTPPTHGGGGGPPPTDQVPGGGPGNPGGPDTPGGPGCPEPSSLVAGLIGLAAMRLARRRRQQVAHV